jgi:CYTH domain-containing protein
MKMNDFELQIVNIGKQSELYIAGESFHQDDFEYEVSLADAKEAVAILNEFIELKENEDE